MPRVSVIVPAYNQAQFLAYALRSALAQTLADLEIIVIDDGSTDDTANVAAEFADKIVYLWQANQGLAAARNTGARIARSELLHFLDSDDALRVDFLLHCVRAAELQPMASVFTGSWEEMDVRGDTMARVTAPALPGRPFHTLFDPMTVGPPCRYVVRRAIFMNAGGFDHKLQACEDWDLWLRLAGAGAEFCVVPDAYACYRNYPGSMSKDMRLMWRNGTRVLAAAARVHHNCRDCDAAYRRGVDRWREWCYLSMLAPRLRANLERKAYPQAAFGAVESVICDPRMLKLLLAGARARLWRRRRPGSNAINLGGGKGGE